MAQNPLPPTCAAWTNTTITPVDISDQQFAQSTPTPLKEAFKEQQQIITQLHLKLEIQMQQFFAFIEQCQNDRSMHDSSPPTPPPQIDVRYSQAKTYQYFINVHCTPAASGSCWQHRIWCTHPQHQCTYVLTMTSPTGTWNRTRNTWNTGWKQKNNTRTTVPVSVMVPNLQLGTQPTASTATPYDDKISTKKMGELPQLTVPMTSYCPPWPPPIDRIHRMTWYSTRATLTPKLMQHCYYTNNPEVTYSPTQNRVVPPTPTTSDKNLLWPP